MLSTYRKDLGIGSELVLDAMDGEEQALKSGVLRRRDGEEAGRAVERGAGSLDVLVVRVGCDVDERGAGVNDAGVLGQDGGAGAVGDRLVNAPVLARGRRARGGAVMKGC